MRYAIIIAILATAALVGLNRAQVANGVRATCERAVHALREGKTGVPTITRCQSAVQ